MAAVPGAEPLPFFRCFSKTGPNGPLLKAPLKKLLGKAPIGLKGGVLAMECTHELYSQ